MDENVKPCVTCSSYLWYTPPRIGDFEHECHRTAVSTTVRDLVTGGTITTQTGIRDCREERVDLICGGIDTKERCGEAGNYHVQIPIYGIM